MIIIGDVNDHIYPFHYLGNIWIIQSISVMEYITTRFCAIHYPNGAQITIITVGIVECNLWRICWLYTFLFIGLKLDNICIYNDCTSNCFHSHITICFGPNNTKCHILLYHVKSYYSLTVLLCFYKFVFHTSDVYLNDYCKATYYPVSAQSITEDAEKW